MDADNTKQVQTLNEIPIIDGIECAEMPELPEIRWINIESLFVNAAYQRDILQRGKKVIRTISKDFHWARFGIVTVMDMEDSRYSVLDGQHRCASLKSMGAPRVPCLVVPKDDLQAQAKHFMGINMTRTAMTPVAQFKARLMAEEPEAIELFEFIKSCGVIPILYTPNPKMVTKPSLMSYSMIEKLYKDRLSRDRLKAAIEVSARCGQALIGGRVIRAIFNFLSDPELSESVDVEVLVTAISELGPHHLQAMVQEHRRNTGDTVNDSGALVVWRVYCDAVDAAAEPVLDDASPAESSD